MLQLPLVVRPAGPRHVPAALPAAGPGSTSGLTIAERQQLPWVLVVDDEPSIREVAGRLLMRQGWNVALAADGDDALMQALSHPFDLVLMDHRMPGRSGAETWRALVGHDPSYRNRVILVSANEVEPELDALATDNSVVVLDKAATLKPATLAPQLQAHLEAVGRRATPGDHVEFAGSGGRPGPASARVPEEPLA